MSYSQKTRHNAHILPERDYVTFGYMLSQIPLSDCRLSVTFVQPTQSAEIFRNISTLFCTLHLLTSVQTFTKNDPGKLTRRWLNARGVAKYSNVGHVEGYRGAEWYRGVLCRLKTV